MRIEMTGKNTTALEDLRPSYIKVKTADDRSVLIEWYITWVECVDGKLSVACEDFEVSVAGITNDESIVLDEAEVFNLLESGFKITDIEWETFNNNEDWSEVSDETVRILTICCSHDGKSFDAPEEIIINYYSMTNATASTTENSIN